MRISRIDTPRRIHGTVQLQDLRGRVLKALIAFGRAVQTSYRCSFFARRAKNEQQKKGYYAAAGEKTPVGSHRVTRVN
jgi:hypothetical protein